MEPRQGTTDEGQFLSQIEASVVNAGEIALTIVRIAADHPQFGAMVQALANYLAPALQVDSVALYWREARERRGIQHPILREIAFAPHPAQSGETATKRLKFAAYRSLSTSRLISRFEPATGRRVISQPIGDDQPWAVLVIEWRGMEGQDGGWREQSLAFCAPSLALATRPAHVQEETLRAEQSARSRRGVFALTSEAVVSIGEDLMILETNPAFGKVLNWQDSAAVGRPCFEVLRCRDSHGALLCATPRCPARRAFDEEGELPVTTLSWDVRGGRSRDMSASISATRGPSTSRVVMVARDVSALNTADRMRSNFISMVSHELRTPLNSINGFLEIVAEEQVGPLNERQHEFLGYARQSTQQLTTLVEDILFITKADSGEFKMRWVDVEIAQVVALAIKGQEAAAQKAEVRVTADVPNDLPTLRGDELRLQQVLNNLLSNAIKFSPVSSEVRLTAQAKEDRVLFTVQDAGKGVAPDEQARIFERFYQSESTLRTRGGGYGLGLAIAKLIVEQHGGTIWVESEPGAGATFSFTIPLKSPESL